jgi:hypothetical protein
MPMETFAWPGYDDGDPGHRTLQGFLVIDVQYAPEHADAMLADIQAYRRGDRTAFEGSGNGYEFECRPEGLFIDALYEGDELTPVTVDYQTVETALTEWGRYCRQRLTGSPKA